MKSIAKLLTSPPRLLPHKSPHNPLKGGGDGRDAEAEGGAGGQPGEGAGQAEGVEGGPGDERELQI